MSAQLDRLSAERAQKRFTAIACNSSLVTANLYLISKGAKAPEPMGEVFSMHGPAGPQRHYSATCTPAGRYDVHLHCVDRAPVLNLLAAMSEAHRAAGRAFAAAGIFESTRMMPEAAAWMCTLFNLGWSGRAPAMPYVSKDVVVRLDRGGHSRHLFIPAAQIGVPDKDPAVNRALRTIAPNGKPNWIVSQIDDVAGVSAAALDWILSEAVRIVPPDTTEQRILKELRKLRSGKGLMAKEIADKLKLTESTLRRHHLGRLMSSGQISNTPGVGYHLRTPKL